MAALKSCFSGAPRYPKDAIFALTAQYKIDSSPSKVNLGQGAYRDDTASPWILPSVFEARKRISTQNLDHEYLPILGLDDFRKAACRMVVGESAFQKLSPRIASSQSLSGTGGLHLLANLIKNHSALKPQVWIPEPTWSNHHLVFSSLGFQCRSFRYYDFVRRELDMEAYKAMLYAAEPNSIIALHACAHNPTGCDPTKEQWREIGKIMKQRQLYPLFDAAYLGFNSGSVDNDAYAIRYFINDLQMEAAVAMSFAKNMGLYGERVGCTFVVTPSQEVSANVESVLERIQRSEVSNPPAYGAKIASQILNDSQLTQMWFNDLKTMCSRIRDMRKALYDRLVENGTPGDWTHVVSQSGMFSFLGLDYKVVLELRERYHIYMADNSRISIAGLNRSNVTYVADAISECLDKCPTATAASDNRAML